MSAQDQAKNDSSEGESSFGFGRYLGLGLFDQSFGEVGKEVGVGFGCIGVEHHRWRRGWFSRKLFG
jgi:hypothetical protein